MTLSEFLAFATNRSLAGVVIYVEHAAFLATTFNYSITDAVISALYDAGYSNTTHQEVMIESPDSALLKDFKQKANYKLVYKINITISDANAHSITDIKDFANAVAVNRESIYPDNIDLLTTATVVVSKFQKAGFEVYAYGFQNEFLSQPWDFLSDATVEINAHVQGAGVDGIITDFPGTARRYKGNSCNKLSKSDRPKFMQPVIPGHLLHLLSPRAMPPALPPSPSLNDTDIVEVF